MNDISLDVELVVRESSAGTFHTPLAGVPLIAGVD